MQIEIRNFMYMPNYVRSVDFHLWNSLKSMWAETNMIGLRGNVIYHSKSKNWNCQHASQAAHQTSAYLWFL